MANKKIVKYSEEGDYRIEETKSIKVVSTANLKVLEKEIENLNKEIDEKVALRDEKKALLKELKEVK